MSYNYIRVDKTELPNDSGLLVNIKICNPAKLNILTAEATNELGHAINALRSDRNIRAVVLTGESQPPHTASFCAGANIKEMASICTEAQASQFIQRIYKLCYQLYNWNVVTIARIDGLCFGAGLELAACCDFRYGTERSTFSMKEVAVGIPSVVHARLLANIMGWQAAKRMVFLGKVVEADEAHRSDLLDAKFSTVEEMDSQIQEDVHLVASYSPSAMRVQKHLFTLWESEPLHDGIGQGIKYFSQMWIDGGTEPKKHMRAWMDRSREKKAE